MKLIVGLALALALSGCGEKDAHTAGMENSTDFEHKKYDDPDNPGQLIEAQAYAKYLCLQEIGFKEDDVLRYDGDPSYLGDAKFKFSLYMRVYRQELNRNADYIAHCLVNTENKEVISKRVVDAVDEACGVSVDCR